MFHEIDNGDPTAIWTAMMRLEQSMRNFVLYPTVNKLKDYEVQLGKVDIDALSDEEQGKHIDEQVLTNSVLDCMGQCAFHCEGECN